MKGAIAVAMLAAAPLHAGTFTWDFTKTSAITFGPCDIIANGQHPTVTNNGITATFSPVWAYAVNPTECNGLYDHGGDPYAVYPSFVNAPSAPTVGYACPVAEGGSSDWHIEFNPPIRFFSMWYSATAEYRRYACPGYYCNGGPYCAQPGPMHAGNPFAPYLSMVNGITSHASVSLPRIGDGFYEVGSGAGSPTALHVQWHYMEIVSPVPAARVVFNIPGVHRIFLIDNITASDGVCPVPPCEFFRAGREREGNTTPTQHTSWGRVKAIYR